jgi:hypothetical protein
LELLGKVHRGYFIESHQGEQYGLPEAIELLRDCRARRGEGELGYLPDEPVLTMTNRDPANLYATCLDIVEERGECLPQGLRQGNLVRRMVVQAGQVLLCGEQQLAPLTRRQLAGCLEPLKHDYAGQEVSVSFWSWNGYPIDASPVAGLLGELGFRFDARGHLCWPPSGEKGSAPSVTDQEVFLPYYLEPPPVQYGPAHTINRAPEGLQPVLQRLFDFLVPELDHRDWEVTWHDRGLEARYRGAVHLDMYIARSFVDVNVRTRSFRDQEQKHRFHQSLRAGLDFLPTGALGKRMGKPEDLNEAFFSNLREVLDTAEELTDRFLGHREKEETST